MPSLHPDRSARRASAAAEAGAPDGLTECEGKLFDILTEKDESLLDNDVREAFELSTSSYRHVLNALLLVKATEEQIATGLDMTPACVAAYRELFFDTRVFKNAFHVRTFIANLPKPPDSEAEEFKAYDLALLEGADALIDRYRVGEAPAIEPKDVVNRAVKEFLSRSREHRGRSLTSKVAQESLRCAREAVSASSHLHSIAPSNLPAEAANARFKLALVPVDLTTPPDASPVPTLELIRSGPATPAGD